LRIDVLPAGSFKINGFDWLLGQGSKILCGSVATLEYKLPFCCLSLNIPGREYTYHVKDKRPTILSAVHVGPCFIRLPAANRPPQISNTSSAA